MGGAVFPFWTLLERESLFACRQSSLFKAESGALYASLGMRNFGVI